jgi:hypothetical protein
MKREKFALFILLVEIVAITVLHSARNKGTPPAQAAGVASQQALQAAQTTFQWNNNNFSLIRIK